MPAKRKQPSDAAEPSTRTTRTSTRTATAKNTAASRAKGSAAEIQNPSTTGSRDVDDLDAIEVNGALRD
ncbi:hypothetical protein D9619_005605 [Psilocybe cf. subviscida]|uniref:Uncharacterized protein n=1 Tax=Psilocybe cf. subviscida TaxID=2480587 RepID=A0A8H5FBK6_9AGAR|nr:hypothetical protein D9619_005605 [Psilocybe cf. subviscida]